MTLPAILLLPLAACSQSGGEPEVVPVAAVATAPAIEGSLSANAVSYGTVTSAPRHTFIVAVLHDAVVKSVNVRDGAAVQAGAALVTVSPAPTAIAQFAQSSSTLDFATQDLARVERLYADKLASNDQLAAARKAKADAQVQLEQLRATGSGAAEEVLRAPFAGVISGLRATAGDRLQANTVLGTLSSSTDLVVQLGLEPRDAARLAPGAAVRLVSPLDATVVLSGRLTSVGAFVDPVSRLVKAVASIPATPPGRVTLGMTLIGHLTLPPHKGILIPRTALLEDSQGTYVFAVIGGKAHRQAVQVVVETDDKALVSAGLAAGTRVIVTGNAALQEGTAVQEPKP
ncbi:MAG: efflux RND transporter periplasmic adaptor subunit [Gammaproteobacteria bacterium]|nr:efflux RND transporter periplasmic adaptor subunit [Gammaproteobacteria bacterium]